MGIAPTEPNSFNLRGVTTGLQLDAVHPGSVLLTDFIEAMGLSTSELAKTVDVHERCIGEICAGERGITEHTAERLGRAFGVGPQFWLNLQTQYEIDAGQV